MDSLVLLILVQILIGEMPVAFWIPGMAIAVSIMYATVWQCCGFSKLTAAYWMVRAFALAEFTASLEWQLHYFLLERYGWDQQWFHILFLIFIYGGVYFCVYFLESRQNDKELKNNQVGITGRELCTAAGIGLMTFIMSNLSYVYSYTPFSSTVATEVFNIRTLVCLGGVGFLYAYHVQCCEYHMKAELDAIQNILRMQYAQYRQSKESIDLVNHKYHDLKHQIAILRRESDPNRRTEYLDEIEQGIQRYEVQYKTGNAVLDTVLTGKGLSCAKLGITMTCVADGALLDSIYVMDICTLFGNALDNAIEYEAGISDKEKRLIHVSVSSIQDFVLIRVENYLEDASAIK